MMVSLPIRILSMTVNTVLISCFTEFTALVVYTMFQTINNYCKLYYKALKTARTISRLAIWDMTSISQSIYYNFTNSRNTFCIEFEVFGISNNYALSKRLIASISFRCLLLPIFASCSSVLWDFWQVSCSFSWKNTGICLEEIVIFNLCIVLSEIESRCSYSLRTFA